MATARAATAMHCAGAARGGDALRGRGRAGGAAAAARAAPRRVRGAPRGAPGEWVSTGTARGGYLRRRPAVAASASAGEAPTPSSSQAVFEPLMRGVRGDVARRLPHLRTDVLDGLNVKCLASTCFMFFGCIAPAIAFGGVLEVATRGAMVRLSLRREARDAGPAHRVTVLTSLARWKRRASWRWSSRRR